MNNTAFRNNSIYTQPTYLTMYLEKVKTPPISSLLKSAANTTELILFLRWQPLVAALLYEPFS